jgi:tetratricopeptide (TPR) repeat protein
MSDALADISASGVMAPPPGAVAIGTEELVTAAGPNTAAHLLEALELRAQHREREAIDALYEAFHRDLGPRAKAELHMLIGNSFLSLSELEEAEGHYRQALDASRQADHREGEAAALGNLGIVYYDQGDLKLAEDHYLQALHRA